ncbi:P27 family phage terminase small subunit [Rhizobium sp. LjRoot254]|uniref:P27 family phage terminase small subunit n=1 Tax=Rhizobium sp. LjRoot254 TaxID=3342297 RepID=UPI003ECE50F8
MGGRGSGGHNLRPAKDKKLEGRRDVKPDPVVELDDETEYLNLTPPDHFGDEEQRLWSKLYIAIPRRFWGVASHEHLLEMAVDAWFSYRTSRAALLDEGMVITDEKGVRRRNPFTFVAKSALGDFTKLCVMLGIGNAERTSLVVHGSEEIDWLEELERAERLTSAPGRRH